MVTLNYEISGDFAEDFQGCIAELVSWFQLGTKEDQATLVQAIRHMSDMIDEDMPLITED